MRASALRRFVGTRATRRTRRRRRLGCIGRGNTGNSICCFCPAAIFLIIFAYVPYTGLVMAFQNFSPRRGILGSPWVGLEHFQYLFGRAGFFQILLNTVLISLYKLVFGMPMPIIFALLLNEIRWMAFRRVSQTLASFPHFLSWVVYGGLMVIFLRRAARCQHTGCPRPGGSQAALHPRDLSQCLGGDRDPQRVRLECDHLPGGDHRH